MNIRAFKYLSPLIIYLGAFWSFSTTGWQVWLPIVWAWIIIPLAELLIKPVPSNMSAAEEELAKKERTYDFLLYFIVILQYSLLIKFLLAMSLDEMTGADIAGRIWVMGLLCGTFGINVGHELFICTFLQNIIKDITKGWPHPKIQVVQDMESRFTLFISAPSSSAISVPGILPMMK